MLRNSNIHANPVIVETIERLYDEDRQFERTERRLSFRETFSRPVKIHLSEATESVTGFSKNISFEGVGVVSKVNFADGSEAKIEIHSSQDKNPIILSRLAWSKPFGEGWYISGWRFVTSLRG